MTVVACALLLTGCANGETPDASAARVTSDCKLAKAAYEEVRTGPVTEAQAAAAAALEVSADSAILSVVPGAGAYSARGEVNAGSNETAAHPSAAVLMSTVRDGADALAAVEASPKCATSSDLKRVKAATEKLAEEATALVEASASLSADVDAFIAEEQARIAASGSAGGTVAVEGGESSGTIEAPGVEVSGGEGGGTVEAPGIEIGGGEGGGYINMP